MTKYIEEAKVIGQWVLNAVTRELDMIAPKIAAEAVPGQFVNVQVSRRTAPLLRRPLGVAGVDRKRGVVRLVYRFVGEATNILGDVCMCAPSFMTSTPLSAIFCNVPITSSISPMVLRHFITTVASPS